MPPPPTTLYTLRILSGFHVLCFSKGTVRSHHTYIYVNSSYSIEIWHLLFRTFVPYILTTLARCQSQITFQTSKQLSYNTTSSLVPLATVHYISVWSSTTLKMVALRPWKKKNRRLGDWFNWHLSYARMTDINTRPIQLATSTFELEG